MCIKRGNVKIKRIISDLRDAIVDSKKVVSLNMIIKDKRGISYSKRITFFESTK